MKRIAVRFVALLGCVALAFGIPFGLQQLQVYRYDAAYGRVEFGDGEECVISYLGEPHEGKDATEGSRAHGIKRFLIYRVGRQGRGGVTWTIGVDTKGQVVSRHRDDDGC